MSTSLKIDGFDCANLHDAIMKKVIVSWEKNARVAFLMITNEIYIKPSRTVTLIGKRLKHLVCPHENPWGHSNFINSVQVVMNTEAEQTAIEIEMQSGDVIQVTAETFEVKLDEVKSHVNIKDD